MHILIDFFAFFGTICMTSLIFYLVIHLFHVHPTYDEYLGVMSYEWQTAADIQAQLEKMKKGKIIVFEFYWHITKLLHDGLIEERFTERTVHGKTVRDYEFRKKSGGKRRKIKPDKKRTGDFGGEYVPV